MPKGENDWEIEKAETHTKNAKKYKTTTDTRFCAESTRVERKIDAGF